MVRADSPSKIYRVLLGGIGGQGRARYTVKGLFGKTSYLQVFVSPRRKKQGKSICPNHAPCGTMGQIDYLIHIFQKEEEVRKSTALSKP